MRSLLTRSGLPKPVMDKLVAASQAALAQDDMRSRFAVIGAEIAPLPGERFDTYIREEIAKFESIASDAGIEKT